MNTVTPRRARLTPEARKEMILQCALAAAELKGFTNFSSGDVASAADCGHPLVYHHFHSMDNLRREVMKLAIKQRNLTVIAQGLANKDPVAATVSDALKAEALKNI